MWYNLIILLIGVLSFNKINAQATPSKNSENRDLTSKSDKQLFDKYLKKQNQLISTTDTEIVASTKTKDIKESTLKFVILCFSSSPSNNDEIASLNKLAYEYRSHISSVVIYVNDLNKYTEIFTKNEFKSLQNFILNKNDYQKKTTSFPVILILDTSGKIINAWSGDKTDDGLKKDEFYTKIKTGLEAISKK